MKSLKEFGFPIERRRRQPSSRQLSGGDRNALRRVESRAGLSNAFLFSFLCFVVLALAGCSTTRPQLGAVSVTDSKTGTAISSVIVNATANVSVSVGSDGPNLGVDWTLICGGSPNTAIEAASVACGTLNPVHVGSSIDMLYTAPAYIPVGSTVTLTAAVTSDPSVSASVTLTIAPKAVTIAFTQGELPPATGCPAGIAYCMAASQAGFQVTAQLAATVSNDPTAVGVIWSCAPAAACGSFSPTHTASGATSLTLYTVPATALAAIPAAGLPVTITATPACESEALNPCSSTVSIGEAITVMPVAVAAAALPSTVAAGGGTATLTAAVSWDAASAGVTWSAACAGGAACGGITAQSCTGGGKPTFASTCTATYTAPQSLPAGAATLPVTVTATSNADSTRSGSAAITVGPPPPVSVSVAGPSGSSQIESQVNGTTILTATVANDFSSGGASAGVNWSCAPGSCDPVSSTTLPFTTTYTAPATIPSPNPITVTAASIFCAQNPASSQCSGDSASTGSASITIVPAISVAIAPPASITAGVGATFSATVTNDINNAGVDWTPNCFGGSTNCGSFNPAHTASGQPTIFTAPNNLPWSENPSVTITATSTASQTVAPVFPQQFAQPNGSDPVSVTVTPVTYVHFVPFAPSQLALAGNAVNLIAAAANDAGNAGVDWSVCSSASTCGQFLVSPAIPQTLTAGAVSAVYSATLHAASGQAVSYLPPAIAPTGGTVTIAVASTATPTASAAQIVAIANTNNFTGVALTGKVTAGSLPVSGATVQLYQAGNTGYGSASAPLTLANGANSVSTASDGSFTISAGYSCSSASALLYLVATGGTPSGQKSPNGELGLLTALGPCSNLNSSVSLAVNEVTTVATAWALAPFTGTGGGKFQNYEYIGSSAANYGNGLANAFAAVNSLVDITTGTALQTTPAGGGFTPPGGTSKVFDGVVPQAEIDTLADAIDTCAATTGGQPGDGSACDAFFQASDVNPVGGNASSNNSPDSILQAVLEVAKYPSKIGIGTGNQSNFVTGTPLYNLVSNLASSTGTLPFQPILSAAPTDWSIALSFTGGGLEGVKTAKAGPSAMAIDAAGNLWIANRSISSVTELSNLGAFLSPYATGSTLATAGGFKGAGVNRPKQIAIDPYGNAWTLNNDSSISEGASACFTATSRNPFCASASFPYMGLSGNLAVGLAIDGTGNLWVADSDNSGTGGDVAEYAGFYSCQNGSACAAGGTQVAIGGAIADYTGLTDSTDNAASASPQTIAIDGKDNVWVLDSGNYAAVELSGKNGSLELVDYGYRFTTNGIPDTPALNSSQWGDTIAVDKTGDIFIPDDSLGNQMYELYEPGGTLDPKNYGLGLKVLEFPNSPNNFSFDPTFNSPIAIDGAGNLWLLTNPPSGTSDPDSIMEYYNSGTPVNGNYQSAANPTSFGYVASNYAFVPHVKGSTELCETILFCDAATPWNLTSTSIESIATDASGNLWVLYGGTTPEVWEFAGVGTPVVTPLSLGKPGVLP